MKKIIVSAFTAAGFFLAGALFAAGQTMYVAVEKASLKASAGMFSGASGNVVYGDEVIVLSTSGAWSQVQLAVNASVKGWIKTASLTKKRILAKGARVSVNASELALAGKGFNAEVESEYKKSGKVNYSAVDRVEAAAARVYDGNVLQFIKDGKLKGAQ